MIFYISPKGRDDWSGRLADPDPAGADGPFATLERARRAVRELKQARMALSEDIQVVLRRGDYELDRCFTLDEADSGTPEHPVVYRAAPGETVRLLGGRKLAWTLLPYPTRLSSPAWMKGFAGGCSRWTLSRPGSAILAACAGAVSG